VILLFLAGLLASGTARAETYDHSYASDDLGRLSVGQQVRTIEDEYRAQSDGRRIPDDQLDFYLDQVRTSHWDLGQVHDDIAQSLRGNEGGYWRPPSSGWDQREVICTSLDRQYRECPTPFRGPARLSSQISSARCVEGRNWGSRPGLIWVAEGCRARFVEGRPYWPDWGVSHGERQVLCESHDNRYQQCNTGFRALARISRQLSQSPCNQGRTWGQAPGMVWVSRGCRAWFEETGWPTGSYQGNYPGSYPGAYPGNVDYNITCASVDGRYASCGWNSRYGLPQLIEQLSDRPCEEGRSWGYRNGDVWVDDGCRGRFGPQ
jgi:hypothetical protein